MNKRVLLQACLIVVVLTGTGLAHGQSDSLRIGIIGTGKIGECVARILHGFGSDLYAFDPNKNPECVKLGVKYVPLEEYYWAARTAN